MAATLDELERRVIALEKAQNENTITLKWVAGTLAQVEAFQMTIPSVCSVSRGASVPSR